MEKQDPTTSETGDQQLPEPPESVKGAVEEPVKGAEGAVEATPPPPAPRVYSEKEWKKRQASWDEGIAKREKALKEQLDAERKQREDAQEALEQRRGEELIAQVQTAGGDVNAARTITAKAAALREQERELRKERLSIDAERAELSPIRKRQDAQALAQKYEVDVEPLLEAENPVEMELLALKLSLEKAKIGAKPPVKTDSDVSTTKGVDITKLSSDEKILRGLGGIEI